MFVVAHISDLHFNGTRFNRARIQSTLSYINARAAGIDNASVLELEGSTLKLSVTAPSVGVARRAPRDTAVSGTSGLSGFEDRLVPTLGENAVRGIMDILTGRQDPPGAHSR